MDKLLEHKHEETYDLGMLLNSLGLKHKQLNETSFTFNFPPKSNRSFKLKDDCQIHGKKCFITDITTYRDNENFLDEKYDKFVFVYRKDTFDWFDCKVFVQMIEYEEPGVIDPKKDYCNYKVELSKKTKSGISSEVHYSKYLDSDIIGYVRVSTVYQLDGKAKSIDTQEYDIYREAEKQGKKLRALYFDYGKSGKGLSIARRLGLMELFNEARNGDIMIFASLSRFTRNTGFFISMNNAILEKNIRAKYLDYPQLDFTEPTAKMILTVLSALAEYELSAISKRVKDTREFLISQGILMNKPHYGKKVITDEDGRRKMVVDEKEQEVIDMIGKIVKKYKNMSYGVIIKELKNKGIKPLRRCTKWEAKAISRIMTRNNIKFDRSQPKMGIVNGKIELEDPSLYINLRPKKIKEESEIKPSQDNED